MIYAGADQPLHPEVNPKSAFDRLFKGVMPATPGATPPAMTDDSGIKEAARQKSVLDLVAADLKRLRGRIGSEDFAKVDAHLEALAAIERRVGDGTAEPSTPGTLGCQVPASPSGGGYDEQLKSMTDIAVSALSCDVTRVMSLQWSYAFSHIKHTWIGLGDHHNYSHDGSDRIKELTAIDNWYAKQFLYLLQQLDSVKEGNGTLLDNTLVVLGRELGSTSHRMDRAPFIIAGGAGGALKGGRFLNFDGQPHAKLLVSLGKLMGLDMETFGDIDPNSGSLTGIA
jgi:hypothetical protein